jgi:hypothetical protein
MCLLFGIVSFGCLFGIGCTFGLDWFGDLLFVHCALVGVGGWWIWDLLFAVVSHLVEAQE